MMREVVLYETFADKIVVHAVLDGRRDMQSLLTQRILRGRKSADFWVAVYWCYSMYDKSYKR